MSRVLGVYILAGGAFSNEKAQLLAAGMKLKFMKMMGKWDGRMLTAYEAPIGNYRSEEIAMGAFITQNGGEKFLTKRNTAIFWHDTTYPEAQVYCCILVKGRFEEYASADTLTEGAGGKASKKVAKLLKAGKAAERKKDWNKALQCYAEAAKEDRDSKEVWAGSLRASLHTDSLKSSCFQMFMNYGQRFGQKSMDGEDFAMLAQSLYVYIEAGREAELDAQLAGLKINSVGYMLQAISDARYLGVDKPEFKEMEKAAEAKTGPRGGAGSFFNRK